MNRSDIGQVTASSKRSIKVAEGRDKNHLETDIFSKQKKYYSSTSFDYLLKTLILNKALLRARSTQTTIQLEKGIFSEAFMRVRWRTLKLKF